MTRNYPITLNVNTISNAPLISFLTVNFYQYEITIQFLESLSLLSYSNWECIVVNNGEPNPKFETDVKNFDKTSYLETGSNLGFAGGNNAGVELCQGEYIYFINNDTEVTKGLLEPILELFEAKPSIGMVSSKIIYHDKKNIIQYAGASELNPYTMRNFTIGAGEKELNQFNDSYPTSFGHGASMVVPISVIERVGLMYNDYFLYYEEYDWCQRIKNAGFEIYYCGQSFIYHKESVSTGQNSPLKIYYLTRNRLLFARRNYTSTVSFVSIVYFIFFAAPLHSSKHVVKGEFKQLQAIWKGVIWNVFHSKKVKTT